MKLETKTTFIIFLGLLALQGNGQQTKWELAEGPGYSLSYTRLDHQDIEEYQSYFISGKKAVEAFFSGEFKTDFQITVHPTRASLDSTWQQDWGMPDFKSQCWMVASGVARKMDIIAPKRWDSLACEHRYADTVKTQRLITHELVHVFHGQYNVSPDFSDVSGIDWFVEGLATYASGQCDTTRISEVKQALLSGNTPKMLNKFWTGNLRYGLSGTVVMYLDTTYGRRKLSGLLQFNKLEDLLNALETTEPEILKEWVSYIAKL